MILENVLPKIKHALYAKNLGTLQSAATKKDRRQSYHQSASFAGTNKTSTQSSKQKLRPVVKVHMVNEQGDYEGDAHWDVVENSIGPINYTDSVDLVYNPHYKQTINPTTSPPTTREQAKKYMV